jgi:uncharacterized membrane protein
LLRRRKRVEFEITPATFETLGLAATAGLRSMAAPALIARAIRRGDLRAPDLLPALGEMVADKTPLVPSRTSAPALLGRLLSGALAGATLFAAEGRRRNSGAILGALSAFAAAHAGERLRAAGVQKGIPDPILGTLEDRIVLVLGRRVLRRKD